MAHEFKFVRADKDENLLLATFRLRYEVYCHEMKFLNTEDYPDGVESDHYDKHSVHFAAVDENENVVGSMRLVLKSDEPFPLEKYSDRLAVDMNTLPRDTIGEISRLVISKKYRRRWADGQTGIESYPLDYKVQVPPHVEGPEKREKPIIVLGLIKILYQTTKQLGITHWYASMEKRLWKSLKNFSFYLDPIGPEFNYYGQVVPYMAYLPEFERKLSAENPRLFALLREGMDDIGV